jgi:hypothetical protein
LTETAFEARWRSATRRRYGALALVADLTLAALMVLLVIGPLWVIRRQRDARRLAVLRAADEVQERRDRESALEAILAGTAIPQPDLPGGSASGDQNPLPRDRHIK